MSNFCIFFEKRPLTVYNFYNSVPKVSPSHRSTLSSNVAKFVRREIGEIVRYLADQKKNKISPASQTIATVRIAPKISHEQPPTPCSRFHPNRFMFGGVIAERVNSVFCPVECFHDSPEAMLGFGRITSHACLYTASPHFGRYSFPAQVR